MLVAGFGNGDNTVEVLVVFSQKTEEVEVPVVYTFCNKRRTEVEEKLSTESSCCEGSSVQGALCSQFLPSFFFPPFFFFSRLGFDEEGGGWVRSEGLLVKGSFLKDGLEVGIAKVWGSIGW